MSVNSIRYKLDCKPATGKDLVAFADTVTHIDLIDMDIQGAELSVVQDSLATLNAKVYRLIIGTHSAEIHTQIRAIFKDWIVINDVPISSNLCVGVLYEILRGKYENNNPHRFNWKVILEKGCYYNSHFGRVAQCDGELVLDNPAFVDRKNTFSFNDTRLITNDLLKKTSTLTPDSLITNEGK